MQQLRDAWSRAAVELGVTHILGADAFEDRIESILNGLELLVTYESDFDVQRPKTVIRVRRPNTTNSERLDAKNLLSVYDKNVGPRGPLIPEERAWLLGHRMGNGIQGHESEITYHQYWDLYRSDDLAFVCVAMTKLLACLDPDRTSIQVD